MYNDYKKTSYSNFEIYGAIHVLNSALTYNDLPADSLFLSGSYLNSEACACGNAIYFSENEYFSHCFLTEGDDLIGVCYDDDENESFYRITLDDIIKL